MNITLAVAALAFTAGTVSAQTALKAEIPFAFHVGNQTMQPGEYRVRVLSGPSGTPLFSLNNVALNRTVLAVPPSRSMPAKVWRADAGAKLNFACTNGYCELAQVWTGTGDGYNFRTAGHNSETRIAEVALKYDRGN